jgi:hypothetical protein
MSLNEELLERKITDSGLEDRLMTVGVVTRLPQYILLTAKVGTKINRPEAVAQSV